ncbi:MAG: lipid A biosynthesis acyltransferase, partial [Myxococcota bacterium]
VVLLGHVAATVDIPDRRRADANLERAMPELPASERRRISRRMFVHLAVSALESAHLTKILNDPRHAMMTEEHRRLFDNAFARGKGIVAVTGHIGNWELFGQMVAKAGYPITSIAKPLYDPRLTRWVDQQRSARGMQILWRGDRSVPKKMLRVFRNNGVLALLIDQDTMVQGAFVPFFGRHAFTPTAAASMALRKDAAVIIGWSHRHGRKHVFHFERCDFQPRGDHNADVVRLTALLSQRLEAAIREVPEQWVWLHDRWKRQPDVGRAPTAELDLNTSAQS